MSTKQGGAWVTTHTERSTTCIRCSGSTATCLLLHRCSEWRVLLLQRTILLPKGWWKDGDVPLSSRRRLKANYSFFSTRRQLFYLLCSELFSRSSRVFVMVVTPWALKTARALRAHWLPIWGVGRLTLMLSYILSYIRNVCEVSSITLSCSRYTNSTIILKLSPDV